MRETDWETLLRVWMHDPFDKVLDVEGHAARASRYVGAALGPGARGPAASDRAPELAAQSERLPLPTAGVQGERAVGPEKGALCRFHPLSGRPETLHCGGLDEGAAIETINGIVAGLDAAPKKRFLALWRLLPDRVGFPLNALPADTRLPDHTLIDHADIAAGIWGSRAQGDEGGAVLSFALGPVQPFIAAARSLRDFWTGSAILSRMAFAAMRPIIDGLGPTAFVFPALRGNPLMDLWLRERVGLTCVPEPDQRACRSPSLPHRFVALAPWGPDGKTAADYAERCKTAARREWDDLSKAVRERLRALLPHPESACWDKDWSAQGEAFFDIHTTVVPQRPLDDDALARWLGEDDFAKLWPNAAKARGLADAIPADARPPYDGRTAGRWQAQLDLSARIMQAERLIRHVPAPPPRPEGQRVPAKCSLLGSFEQMGPADFAEAGRFWDEAREKWCIKGVRLRRHERFCAIALTKRFAMPAVLEGELGLDRSRFPDTATVAAAHWLRRAGIGWQDERSWNGRWLHDADGALEADGEDRPPPELRKRLSRAKDEYDPPPVYYAVLVMDGDDLGRWLRGEYAPTIAEVMHPKLRNWFKGLDHPAAKAGLKARRPVGPALHAAISGALGHFATRTAPKIVEDHLGTTIYSGGDDLLAVLPARQAVACARELRRAYREGDTSHAPAMGEKATLSAGLAFVHYKEDLRLALQAARNAEAQAKRSGKDALVLRFMRRSGGHDEALLDWSGCEWFDDLTARFADGAGSRWTYRLRAVLPVLSGPDMPDDLIAAEIRRIGDRSKVDDRGEMDDGSKIDDGGPTLGSRIAARWTEYRQARRERAARSGDRCGVDGRLADFVTLCQGAAFVARARDD